MTSIADIIKDDYKDQWYKVSQSRISAYVDCVALKYWKWFPIHGWHLVEHGVGEPTGDEWLTYCGKCLDGLEIDKMQEDQPLLYCKECRDVKILKELGE